MKRLSLMLALGLIAGCTSNNKTAGQRAGEAQPQKQQQPVEFATGREAFQRVFPAARQWASDAQPIRIESQARPENKADGKSDVWGATFVSSSRRAIKPFLWSGTSAEDAPQAGLTPGNEDVYNPANASTQPFNVAGLNVDSDAALLEANKHGGKEQLKKDPKTVIKFALTWEQQKSQLAWHVIYGRNEMIAPLTIFVDATTGKFIRAVK